MNSPAIRNVFLLFPLFLASGLGLYEPSLTFLSPFMTTLLSVVSSPHAPNVGQIPLPPGMTLEQFQALQGSLVTLAIVTAVAFSILVWDYLNLLPDEIKMYETANKKLWGMSATWAFIILRYAGILATFPSLFFTSIQSDHCQAAVVLSQVGVLLVVASSGVIFSCRLFAIWGDHNTVRAVVWVAYSGMIACWVSVATQYRVTNGPHTPFGSNCQIEPIPSWSSISFASSVAFDAIILGLTIAKLNANHTTSSRVGYLIYRDSLMYFGFTAATNITLFIIEAQGSSANLIKATSMPFSTLITVTMGVRVFLNLKLFNYRQEQAQRLPISSSVGSYRDRHSNSPRLPPRASSTTQPALPRATYNMAFCSDRKSRQSEGGHHDDSKGESLETDGLLSHNGGSVDGSVDLHALNSFSRST